MHSIEWFLPETLKSAKSRCFRKYTLTVEVNFFHFFLIAERKKTQNSKKHVFLHFVTES